MLKKLGIGCGGFILLLVVISAFSSGAGPSSDGGTGGSTAKLALLSFSCETKSGFNTCTGEVKNITDKTLKNVTAVASWRDGAGALQRTDEALIDFNPILAGQTSPFTTIGTSNPALTRANVSFKELLGGKIDARDDRTPR